MKTALRELLEALDKVSQTDNEVEDTDVKEQLNEAIYRAFIVPKPGYVLPEKFGMFTPQANARVKQALEQFLAHPEVAAAAAQLPTPRERLDAFQDKSVISAQGAVYDDYFGYSDSV